MPDPIDYSKKREEPYRKIDPRELILRDFLAIDRTELANERTLLAYLRTAIMLFATGVTLLKLFPHLLILQITGYVFLPTSIFLALWGYARFKSTRTKIELAVHPREDV
jgi:putative membrane protein